MRWRIGPRADVPGRAWTNSQKPAVRKRSETMMKAIMGNRAGAAEEIEVKERRDGTYRQGR